MSSYPEAYTELAQVTGVGAERCWPHVVLSDGHVLCRDRAGSLLCFALAE